MAKSKSQTWKGIFFCRKLRIIPGFIATQIAHLYDNRIKFHYIDNDVWTKQTDK